MLNNGMEGLSAFDRIETVANCTFEDVTKRLMTQFNTENVTLSIIDPVNGREDK